MERLAENGVDTAGLGLAIGFEYGPMTITRLGMQGDRVRCSVSRGVLASEAEQKRCLGTETAIGLEGYKSGTEAVRKIFSSKRKSAALTYDLALESLAADQDKTAKAVMKESFALASPALARSVDQPFRPHARAE